ncbi:LPS export ABC transporter periplasmic protein LptC [Alkalimarinus alittae]|uniref:Lipopolysaccharide export system protein LptC n=1 Tax=Alkalimarinus alittae TaxID=2961619 RepID=A0ABY6MZD4_9ALTE|nr:LPS export ABC transporter periplasmic protein LptC [Alkalimarinus alittae]UZE95203.1 LPS export ABC transporter periplasmic protein LptC [Alkalimarinus alittae]
MNNEKIKKYAILIVSIFATILIIWQNSDNETPPSANIIADDEADFFIVKGQYTSFDEDGNLSSTMKSDEAKHYPKQNNAILTKPNLLVYREDSPPWRLTADMGQYDMNDENLTLNQNVVIIRNETLETPWTLKTESLTLLNKSRFITTKQPVTISDKTSILEGVGMNAWIDEKKVELTSNVRGYYAPK